MGLFVWLCSALRPKIIRVSCRLRMKSKSLKIEGYNLLYECVGSPISLNKFPPQEATFKLQSR